MADTQTAFILPVDLNALMYKNYKHMSQFCRQLKLEKKAKTYERRAKNMLRTMSELFWDPDANMWFDIDSKNHKRRSYFYASNLFPLWAEAYPADQKEAVGKCAVNYLIETTAIDHTGGVPTSLKHTGHQWDWNAWPPLQQIIVSGLNKTGLEEAKKMAFQIAKNYTLAVIASCNKTSGGSSLFEKYDPTVPGTAGSGGEYKVQTGFGWTNGVLIEFITTYGDDLVEKEDYTFQLAV